MVRAVVPAAPTIAELLHDHPWPRGHGDGRRLEWLWSIDVDLDADQLWPLVSDVSRLNRALGNPEMQFDERDGLRWGRARYGGVLHEWHEVPWDWVAGRWFAFLRVFRRGAMRELYSVHRIEPLGNHRCRLHVYFGVLPRWAILAPPMRVTFARMGRAYHRVVPALAAEARRRRLLSVTPAALPAVAGERLDAIARRLRDEHHDPALVDRLVGFVRGGDDLDLVRIQVRERARAWAVDEDQLLRLFLHATRAGLLELTWDVVCPHCRGVRASRGRLGDVPAEGSCEVCAIAFGTDEAVEVSFRVHPSIRAVAPRLFCSAEPATKPHIQVQRAVPAGADAAVELDLAPGRYRLRNHGERQPAGFLDVAAGAGGDAPVPWRATAPPGELPAPPHASLALVNDSGEDRTFIVETARPVDLALRPGRLFSHQEFRDLFTEEYVGADVHLAVGEQTILFTDIVGSTAMYAERGDPDAFVAVRRHFTEVFDRIGRHRGAVVKTIGDAAMGAFTDPVDAVRAADAIQRAFGAGAPVRLRVSLNTGPCIAVRLNADIDYFGHAVNLAAKLQALAGAGQVVISAATLAAPGVAAYLDRADRPLEEVSLAVKGLDRPVAARRWTTPPDDPPAAAPDDRPTAGPGSDRPSGS